VPFSVDARDSRVSTNLFTISRGWDFVVELITAQITVLDLDLDEYR
jgi:hypothetical protein